MTWLDGVRVRHKETGRVGTVRTVLNGPDALDRDDTIDVVEWDDAGDREGDPTLRSIAPLLEEAPPEG